MKNKGLIIGVGLLVALGIVSIWAVSTFNSKVIPLDEETKASWGEVQNQYQRRADLIPALIETVNKATGFEKSTLSAVIEARAKATSIQVDASQLSPLQIQAFQQAQSGLSSALSRLMATVEAYPDLKSNTTILNFQTQLEGTENRISKARYDFNRAVQSYNTSIQTIPTNIIASFSGRVPKGYFEAEQDAQKAPVVKFKED